MNSQPSRGSHSDDRGFQALLVSCLETLERGKSVDFDRLVAEYPQYAEALRAFLDDQALLKQVAREMRESMSVDSVQEVPAPTIDETIDSNPRLGSIAAGDRIRYIGEYEVLREIARGGMGVVFKARQRTLQRIVALKMILAGQLAEESDVERFQREAQAAGRLKHPNIVAVHEIGVHEGHHYFTMDYIDGHSLSEEIRDESLRPRRAAELVKTVAEAIEFAHQHGILHRDLKPANILIDTDEQPHITDFGLARVAPHDDSSQAELTATGQILGTPGYMSPEQAAGKHHHTGVSSDVYSIGAVLYACLTGRAPFVADTPVDTLLQVVHKEPVPTRWMNPDIPRDLETICLKCLAKEPQKRYQTADMLARDLDNFLEGRPIQARPVGRLERSWRWCRRNRMLAAVGSILLLFLLVLAVGGPITAAYQARLKRSEANAKQQAFREQQEAQRLSRALSGSLEKQRRLSADLSETLEDQTRLSSELATSLERQKSLTQQAERRLYYSQIYRARIALQADQHPFAAAVIENIPLEQRGWEAGYLLRQATGTPLTLPGHDLGCCVAYSPNAHLLVSGGADGMVKLWDLSNGKLVWEQRGHESDIASVAFGPAGRRIVSGSSDKHIKVWDVSSGECTQDLQTDSWISEVQFTPDGHRIVSGSAAGTVRIWREDMAQEVATLQHDTAISSVAVSPDVKTIASGCSDGSLQIWDVGKERRLHTLRGHEGSVFAVAFSPDGLRVASGSRDQTIRVWDATTGENLLALRGHQGYVSDVNFSPDGRCIVSGGSDQTARVWDGVTGEPLGILLGHDANVNCVTFSPAGRRLVSSGERIKVWDRSFDAHTLTFQLHDERTTSLTFSPDSHQLITGSRDGTIRIADVATGRVIHTLLGHEDEITHLSFCPEGLRIISESQDRTVMVWNATTGKKILTLPYHDIDRMDVSSDGRRIVSGGRGSTIKIWDATKGESTVSLRGHQANVTCVAFSPDGGRVVSGGGDDMVKLWNAINGAPISTLGSHDGNIRRVEFHPDGRHLFSVGRNDTAIFWNAGSGEKLLTFQSSAAALSPDGSLIASGNSDAAVELWDVASRETVRTLRGHRGPITSVAFGPAGRYLVTARKGRDGTVRVWNLTTGKNTLTLQMNDADVGKIVFIPNGRRIANGVQVWDPATGENIFTLEQHRGSADCVAFSPDGRRLASGGDAVKVSDAGMPRDIVRLSGHTDTVVSVAFAHEGEHIISWDTGRQKIIWATTTGRRLIDEVSEDDPTPQLSSSHGQLRVIVDGNDVLLVRDNSEVDLWAEDAERRELTNADYHTKAASEAEAKQNWFAASFHLRWLVEHDPGNARFRERLRQAEADGTPGLQSEKIPAGKPERNSDGQSN